MAVKIRVLKQLLRGTLIANSGITDRVDDRIYGAHLQDSDLETVIYPMIVFDVLSGNARWHGAVQTPTVEIYTYSKVSADEAIDIYDDIYELIQHSCLSLTNVATRALIKEVQRPSEGFNQTTRSWFARGRWQLSSTG